MLVLCINSGNGQEGGNPTPIQGVVYNAVSYSDSEICPWCNTNEWYMISSISNIHIHSKCLFEELPDDFLTVKKNENVVEENKLIAEFMRKKSLKWETNELS